MRAVRRMHVREAHDIRAPCVPTEGGPCASAEPATVAQNLAQDHKTCNMNVKLTENSQYCNQQLG
eukprot:364825-Chlamydomonas_euryale.AAC.6